MTDTTTARPVTDARFLDVLRAVADQVVDQTGTSVNGEVWNAYRPYPDDAPDGFVPGYVQPDVWIAEQVEAALTEPAAEADKIRAMLAARARLGENIRLIEDIDLSPLRAVRHKLIEGDQIDALLDFVAEVRQLAKDI